MQQPDPPMAVGDILTLSLRVDEMIHIGGGVWNLHVIDESTGATWWITSDKVLPKAEG